MHAIDETPLVKLERALAAQGIVGGLRVLNGRAPYRFTGIYRYSPNILRNVCLVDALEPALERGTDVALEDAYCPLLSERKQLAFGDLDHLPCAVKRASPVVSYCGTLLVRSTGEPYGSLCHFDTSRCQRASTELEFLESVAPRFMELIEANERAARPAR